MGEYESSIVWKNRIVLYEHFFLFFAGRFVFGPSWIEESTRNRLNAILAICDCLKPYSFKGKTLNNEETYL